MRVYSSGRWAPSAYGIIAGQSVGHFTAYTNQYKATVDRITEKGAGVLPNRISLYDCAVGGSAAAFQHASATSDPDGVDLGGWWYDPDTSTPGALLTNVINLVNGLASDKKPTFAFWDQSYADTDNIGVPAGAARTLAEQRYETATRAIFATFAGLGMTRIMVAMGGRRDQESADRRYGTWKCRQILLKIIGDTGGVFYSHEVFDADLQDGVHPGDNWRPEYGRREADALCRAYGATGLSLGPTVSSVAKAATRQISVALVPDSPTGSTIQHLAAGVLPTGFRFENAEAPGIELPTTAVSRTGGTYLFTVAADVGTPVLMYPYGDGTSYDLTKVIYDAQGKPLRSRPVG